MDLMTKHGISIAPKEGMIYTDEGSAAFRDMPKPLKRCFRIRCSKTVIIPPFTSANISGSFERYSKRGQNGDYYGQMEPYYNTTVSTGILIAHSIANSEDGKIPIRVLNMTEELVVFHKRKIMGQFKPVEMGQKVMRVSATDGEQGDQSTQNLPDKEPLHTHRVKEWERQSLFSELKINELKINAEEKKQLEDICWENRTVFSTGDDDIGCCNFYKAHLELKENYKPRWVPSRPIPYK